MGQRQKPETEAKSYLTSHNKTQRQALSHVHTLGHIACGAGEYSAKRPLLFLVFLPSRKNNQGQDSPSFAFKLSGFEVNLYN